MIQSIKCFFGWHLYGGWYCAMHSYWYCDREIWLERECALCSHAERKDL